MGASTRRKEIRKAKFGQQQPPRNDIVSVPSNVASDEVPAPVKGSDGNMEEQSRYEAHTSPTEAPKQIATEPHRRDRFVCFIGNLPFSTTSEMLAQHFQKVRPASIRHSTSKATGKSRGFAFVEFDGYDRMKTCLKLYHHSLFDDGVSPARKINVELTAGGGGTKSQSRKAKLRLKNEKLDEERRRRAQDSGKHTSSEIKDKTSHTHDDTDADIHPSRRGQITN